MKIHIEVEDEIEAEENDETINIEDNEVFE